MDGGANEGGLGRGTSLILCPQRTLSLARFRSLHPCREDRSVRALLEIHDSREGLDRGAQPNAMFDLDIAWFLQGIALTHHSYF